MALAGDSLYGLVVALLMQPSRRRNIIIIADGTLCRFVARLSELCKRTNGSDIDGDVLTWRVSIFGAKLVMGT